MLLCVSGTTVWAPDFVLHRYRNFTSRCTVTRPNVEATCPGPTGFGTRLMFVLCSLGACSDYLRTSISYAPPRIDNMTLTAETDGCGDPHAAARVNITQLPTTGSFSRMSIWGEHFGHDNSVVRASQRHFNLLWRARDVRGTARRLHSGLTASQCSQHAGLT